MTEASAPVLVARGLYKTYEADLAPIRALRGVDLDVAAGEFVAVMGPSDCGKSTLLNVIAGLDRPDEGEISVGGESIAGQKRRCCSPTNRPAHSTARAGRKCSSSSAASTPMARRS